MKVVRFQQHFRLWSAGELAGFDDDEAARLVAVGVAALELPAAAEAAPSAAPSEEAGQTPPQASPVEEGAPAKRRGRK